MVLLVCYIKLILFSLLIRASFALSRQNADKTLWWLLATFDLDIVFTCTSCPLVVKLLLPHEILIMMAILVWFLCGTVATVNDIGAVSLALNVFSDLDV